MNLADVDLDRHRLGRRSLGPELTETLARYLRKSRPLLMADPDEKALFLTRRGTRLSYKTMNFLITTSYQVRGGDLHYSWKVHNKAKRVFPGAQLAGDPTVVNWSERYLAYRWAQGFHGQSFEMARVGLSRLARFCHDGRPIQGLGREQLDLFRQHLLWSPKDRGDGLLAPKTVHVWLRGVRQFLRWAAQEKLLAQDPTTGWDLTPTHRRSDELLTGAEIEELLTRPKATTPVGQRDRAILGVMCELGMFADACRKLKVGDLDLARGLLGDKALGLRLSGVLRTYLEQGRPKLAKDSGSDVLFVTTQGAAITFKSFQNLLWDRYGVSTATLHKSWRLQLDRAITRRLPGI